MGRSSHAGGHRPLAQDRSRCRFATTVVRQSVLTGKFFDWSLGSSHSDELVSADCQSSESSDEVVPNQLCCKFTAVTSPSARMQTFEPSGFINATAGSHYSETRCTGRGCRRKSKHPCFPPMNDFFGPAYPEGQRYDRRRTTRSSIRRRTLRESTPTTSPILVQPLPDVEP
jgi:hypothetical protein